MFIIEKSTNMKITKYIFPFAMTLAGLLISDVEAMDYKNAAKNSKYNQAISSIAANRLQSIKIYRQNIEKIINLVIHSCNRE
jgi:hypothetical protein